MMIRTLLAIACVAGFVAGAWWSRDLPADAPPVDQALLLARLDRVERRLAANYPVQASATGVRTLHPASAEPEPRVPPPLTPVQLEGVRAGNEVVDRAIAMGRWSDKDVEALDVATTELDSLERVKILQRVAAAINSDQVRVETVRTPY